MHELICEFQHFIRILDQPVKLKVLSMRIICAVGKIYWQVFERFEIQISMNFHCLGEAHSKMLDV